jgi:two-component system, chemotaxis family, CheB/CheR fusion protein
MLREMNHRVKNMFSIISGMVRLASRTTDSVEDLVDGIQTRVNALARSHDLTQNAPARQTLTLEQTIRASLEPYSGEAVARIEGPVVPIASQELTALSLLLHEWATNAAKYGVLGPADGHLEVTWRRERGGHVILTWNEIHRQEVEPSDGASGFGSTLVQLSAVQLNGQVSVEYGNHERRMTLTYAPDSWS